MLNAIWMGILFVAIVCGAATGRLSEVAGAAATGAADAVQTALLLLGSMCLWLGMMEIAKAGGVMASLARVLSPVLRRLFPGYRSEPAVLEKISMNLSANMLGMGNAATPFGLSAMDEMSRLKKGDTPSNDMILFVVMNTASLQILPSSVVTLRASFGSANPFDVLPHIWFVSFLSLMAAVFAAKAMGAWRR